MSRKSPEQREKEYRELEHRARELVTPIDFDALIEAGILEKKGAWYRVLKNEELPEHAKAKISSMKTDKNGTLVKFRAPSKRLAKIVKPLDS